MSHLLRVGPDAYPSLSAALDDAEPGAVVEVMPGLYSESLVLERPVSLVAIGKVILDGGDQIAVTVAGDRVTLRGFGVRNDGSFPVASLGEGVGVRLEECLLVASGDSPVVSVTEGRPTLDRCRVVGGAGVRLGPSRPRLVDCEIVKSFPAPASSCRSGRGL